MKRRGLTKAQPDYDSVKTDTTLLTRSTTSCKIGHEEWVWDTARIYTSKRV